MKINLRKINMKSKSLNHLAFWGVWMALLTIAWGYGAEISYGVTFIAVILIMPVHLFYFYSISYWVIPKFLYQRRYVKLFFALLACTALTALFFRTIEIFLIEPFLFSKMLAVNPDAKWAKLDGTISERFLNLRYLINAFEQSNIVIWIAISLRFFKMWYEKKQVALQAELNFLKGQIHPHFLFNTLNNLYALTLNQSPKSPAIVLGLSNILRYMLYECNTETVALTRDVEILESYVSLEKIRYEDRIDLNLSITGNLSQHLITPLLMLPLVENAFKHGTSEMIEGAWINIDIQVIGSRLVFKVSNGKANNPPKDTSAHFEKIGLTNVRKRLALLYAGAYQFNIYDEEEMFAVILTIDLNRYSGESMATESKKHNDKQTNLNKP